MLQIRTCDPIFYVSFLCFLISDNGKKHETTIWKRPMLVKGPLGIVSITEIAFLLMFIALLVWTLATYLHNDFLSIASLPKEEHGPKVYVNKVVIITGNLRIRIIT